MAACELSDLRVTLHKTMIKGILCPSENCVDLAIKLKIDGNKSLTIPKKKKNLKMESLYACMCILIFVVTAMSACDGKLSDTYALY